MQPRAWMPAIKERLWVPSEILDATASMRPRIITMGEGGALLFQDDRISGTG